MLQIFIPLMIGFIIGVVSTGLFYSAYVVKLKQQYDYANRYMLKRKEG